MKLRSFTGLVFTLCLLFTHALSAVSIETAELTVEPTLAELADLISLRLQYDPETPISLAQLEKQLFIEGPEGERAFTIRGSRQEPGEALFLLEPWSPGTYTLTFGIIPLDDERVLNTGTVQVKIVPPPEAGNLLQTDLLPLPGRPLIGVTPSTWAKLESGDSESQTKRTQELFRQRKLPWRLLIGSLALVAILWFGRKLLRRFFERISLVKVDPKDKALNALRKLSQENLPKKGFVEPFYIRLTAIVRIYVEETFGIHAPEQTTEEFLTSAHEIHLFDSATEDSLETFLQKADMVKFARSTATVEECSKAFSAAQTLVDQS
jgi:hypothetical protein